MNLHTFIVQPFVTWMAKLSKECLDVTGKYENLAWIFDGRLVELQQALASQRRPHGSQGLRICSTLTREGHRDGKNHLFGTVHMRVFKRANVGAKRRAQGGEAAL